eukprot:TRINITY_DN79020_c0_g1_i1.p2 TRINITY_DN79020_c0_g1~~TRINITY_DN79020_c0_g1_i1.p2  ORF type:complete len:113 (-),score=10.10 TRINITY_DN79020_c0_g1_i1:23-361(-)
MATAPPAAAPAGTFPAVPKVTEAAVAPHSMAPNMDGKLTALLLRCGNCLRPGGAGQQRLALKEPNQGARHPIPSPIRQASQEAMVAEGQKTAHSKLLCSLCDAPNTLRALNR